MSYVTDKWDEGEVTVRGLVCGWFFERTNEFRPLMSDAMEQLLDHGVITQDHVIATEAALEIHTEEFIQKYQEQQEEFWTSPEHEDARREHLSEMRAAFGPDHCVVNAITGRRHKT